MGACGAKERRRPSPRIDSRLSFSARFIHRFAQNVARHSKSATYRNERKRSHGECGNKAACEVFGRGFDAAGH